jgi:hypothetical protein
LLDVDGVINAFGLWPSEALELEQSFEAQGYRIRVPAGTSERLARLAECFEMVWATSWENDAHPAFAERLGLGSALWPVISFGGRLGETMTWKLSAVRAFVGELPCVWIDDDLFDDAFRWAAERSESGQPTLLLRTEAHLGLTEQQTTAALEFVARLSSA